MLAVPTLPSIHEQDQDAGDIFLLKPSYTGSSPTILLSSPNSIYTNGHRRRTSLPDSKKVVMASTTTLDAPLQQYWSPAVNFPPSPTASPAPSSRDTSPESSPPSSAHALPVSSAPPTPTPSPPPYSVHQNDRLASPPGRTPPPKQHQQPLGMPVGTATKTLVDSPPSRFSKHQRPPVPHKPSALRLNTTGKLTSSTSRSSSSSKGWSRFMNSGFTWIGLYFIFNMGLTLYNKTVLVHFPFPYSLTALHTLCGTIGCLWLKKIGYFTPARLTIRQNLTLAAFSVLYTLNIAVSNLSLQLVTVPFHQVVRASAPLFTILVAYILGASKGKGFLGVETSKLLSLVPVIAGVGFATYGDYSFTTWGFILTLLGTFLAALKTVLTSILQTPSASSRLSTSSLPVSTPITAKPGFEFVFPPSPAPGTATLPNGDMNPPKSPYLFAQHQLHHQQQQQPSSSFHSWSSSLAKRLSPVKRFLFKRFYFVTKRFDLDFGLSNQNVVSTSIKLHPLDLLMRMSPLAFVQCVGYAWISGELDRALVHKGPGLEGWSQKSATVLLLNGVIAFLLNIVSLTANQKNGPLTMTVAANVKQVLTILLAMYMFHLAITPANSIGIILTLAGGAWYGAIEYGEKKNRLRRV